MSGNYSFLKLEMEGRLAQIILNRPSSLNAINTGLARELSQVLDQLMEEDSINALLLTGSGERAFCVGADLKERKSMSASQQRRQRTVLLRSFRKLINFPWPLVAGIRGYALGGGFEFALASDLIVAAEDAVFGLPEVGLGIIPGGGGTQLLPRLIGIKEAKELIYTGRRISADEAHRLGLVNRVVAPEELEKECRKLINEILDQAPLALRQAKRAIELGYNMQLESALILEEECYNYCLMTEDRQEGIRAFNESRKPEYRGR